MPGVALVFAVVAALLHVLFFVLESVIFSRPDVYRRFGVRSAADASVLRPMALNQGFYNLFLAVGVLVGVALCASDAVGTRTAGAAVVVFGCASMTLAGVVLAVSNRPLWRSAVIQAGPPLLALLFAATL